MMLCGTTLNSADPNRHGISRQIGDQQTPLVRGALTDEPFANTHTLGMTVGAVVGIGRKQAQGLRFFAFQLVDDALLGIHQRRQLGEQQLADGREVALPLQHVGELGQIGL